jgi:hypothetical protein
MREWLKQGADEADEASPEAASGPVIEDVALIGPPEEGDAVGTCRGFAYVKQVRRTGEEESIRILRIPITTVRVDEVFAGFRRQKQPRPPVFDKLIPAESPEGKALGLTKDTFMSVPNTADEKYQDALEEFGDRQTWAITAEGIDVPLYYVPGHGEARKEAERTEEKIEALKQAGFTRAQVMEVARALARLSAFTDEERRAFFGTP